MPVIECYCLPVSAFSRTLAYVMYAIAIVEVSIDNDYEGALPMIRAE